MPTPASIRGVRFVALGAAFAHLASYIWLTGVGRFFASEDDPYRIYNAYLMARGGVIVGRFWLPGQLLAMSLAQDLGAPARWSGILAGAAAVTLLAWAVVDVTRSLAPEPVRDAAPWAALLVAASSPMTLVLGHSALAEPLECALVMGSAALVLRRARGGRSWTIGVGALLLLAATWVRYESWAVALVFPLAVYLVRRHEGAASKVALRDAAVSMVAWLGPLLWMGAQAASYGNPFAFLDRIEDMAALSAEPSILHVVAHRAEWLALWAPATLAWAALGASALRKRRRSLLVLTGFTLFASLGILAGIGKGPGAVLAFTPRLGYGLEVALWPLAAVGVALAFARAPRLAGAAALVTVAVLSLGVLRPADMQDTSSVTAGLMLSRGELDASLGVGSLLVERLPWRPPFGWASVGVLWGHWERTLWGTLRGDTWQLVEPTNVHAGRRGVPLVELGPWLDAHDVTAAWTLSPESLREIMAVWPRARLTRIGQGTLVSRE